MSTAGDYARSAVGLLTDSGQTERLTFRRYIGSEIAYFAQRGAIDSILPKDVVTLKVNPSSISYSKQKITQKVQTSAPGRFVVFDWGTDLEMITINGQTGNLLPTVIQDGYNPIKPVVDAVIQEVRPGLETGSLGGNLPVGTLNSVLSGRLSYFELIGMSPKYRTFKRLETMFDLFDADRDIMTLEMGEEILRIYLNEFSFEQNAETPWNWKYTMSIVNLKNLAESKNREDREFPNNDFISRDV